MFLRLIKTKPMNQYEHGMYGHSANDIKVLWFYSKSTFYYHAGDMVHFAAIRMKYVLGHK